MSPNKDETVEDLCSQVDIREKNAQPRTWSNIADILIWGNIIKLFILNVGAVVALIIYAFGLYSVPYKWFTVWWIFIYGYGTNFGTTAGAHRMWSHRAYKANLPLKIILMLSFAGTGVNSIFHWVKDHRLHHKYSETDADPHNAKRGFFFAHMGWLMVNRHPEYLRRSREIDLSDITSDPVVMFDRRYTIPLRILLCFIVPSVIPVIFWNETLFHAVLTQCFIRYFFLLHFTWSVSSVAHLWGNRPYNSLINPTQNILVCLISVGEGTHNYHHTFPWDYKTSEFPYINLNLTTLYINAFSKLGWAYDLREASPEIVKKVIRNFGPNAKVISAQ